MLALASLWDAKHSELKFLSHWMGEVIMELWKFTTQIEDERSMISTALMHNQ